MPHIITRDAWVSSSWNAGDERHIYLTGGHIGEVKRDRDGAITASVSVVLIPEHADEKVAAATGFADFDAAREWAETTIDLLAE